ncbi:ERF family protein [Acinetobacter sp. ME22]|uniref:ERF family protein n=1 Tax=Acinetobacter sp. ME22 TaxID=2904802 RepID=UPI001ED9E8FF|nr:ERF family protein [Acinetobacter sp. ME22]MCG2572004.1 ERF family protein [Acinetobacter sp. ME22]
MTTNQQNALQHIQQELKVPKGKYNDFGKFNYRNCEDILEAVKPLLKELDATLVITDEVQQVGPIVVITAKVIFTDSSGQQTVVTAHAGVEINKKGMDVAQTFGASSSYARKYALNGLFLIDDTKDYDSNEYHNQINHDSNNQNNSSNNTGAQQASKQQNSSAQQNNHQPHHQDLESRYQNALVSISNAKKSETLDKALKTFEGTRFYSKISQACQARADQMGWINQNQRIESYQNQQYQH